MRHVAGVVASGVVVIVGVATTPSLGDLMQYYGEGTLVVIGGSPTTVDFKFEVPVLTQLGGFGFTTFVGTATQFLSPDPLDPDEVKGVGLLIGSTPADTLQVEFNGFGVGSNPGTASIAANVFYGLGTGVYQEVVGLGDLSSWVIFTGPLEANMGITLQGELAPAPGSLTLLMGAGAFVIHRRRR